MLYKIKFIVLIIILSISNAFSNQTTFIGEFVQGGIIIGHNKFAKKIFSTTKNYN